MGKSGKTKHPGVYRLGDRKYRIRAKVKDPRTGKIKEVDRIIACPTVMDAVQARAQQIAKIRGGSRERLQRLRVGEYAQSWMRSKALKLDAGTARTYADALDLHILPTLGDFYYEALTRMDVQAWVDESLLSSRVLRSGARKPYARNSVHAWFRVLRTMTGDAMADLRLQSDPTQRISFPAAPGRDDRNALSSEELARFLWEMRTQFPHHFALSAVLAFTGLRFCHASAFKWEDWDEQGGIIRVMRKQIRGRVGQVSRKKKAPLEVPVEPELAIILRQHRQGMLAGQVPGLAGGWMFPSGVGTLRTPSSLYKAWLRCLEAIGIERRFTVHGLRYTFTDLTRRAKADAVVRRALTGHVTESMQDHYSSVNLEEKRAAVAGVHQLVRLPVDGGDDQLEPKSGDQGGDKVRKG